MPAAFTYHARKSLVRWHRPALPTQVKLAGPHKLGCLLLPLPLDAAKELNDWCLEAVPDWWLGPGGRELSPHVTVLYGFTQDTPEQLAALRAFLAREGPCRIGLGGLDAFPGGKDGVPLFLHVDGPQLEDMNYSLRETFPAEVKFPNYVPHVCVAYLDPQFAELAKRLDCPLAGRELTLSTAVYSNPAGDKTEIPLSLLPPLWGVKSQGEPCEQGETAAQTDCIPADGYEANKEKVSGSIDSFPIRKKKEAVLTTARRWNYPEDKIFLKEEKGKQFIVGNQEWEVAGECVLKTGIIEIFLLSTDDEESAKGLTAHEIMHAKFEQVWGRYEEERRRITEETINGGRDLIRASGELRPEYAAEFPVYAKLFPFIEEKEARLAKEDGVTDYSRSYWQDFADRKATRHIAIHETLAEIASLDEKAFHIFGPKPPAGYHPPGSKLWRSFYKAVLKEAAQLNKPKKSKAFEKEKQLFVNNIHFFDDNFKPTDPEGARYCRVWKADGTTLWLTKTPKGDKKQPLSDASRDRDKSLEYCHIKAQPAPAAAGNKPKASGTRKDSLGRERCYQDGKLVPCNKPEETDANDNNSGVGESQAPGRTRLTDAELLTDQQQPGQPPPAEPAQDTSDPQFQREWAAEVEKQLAEIERANVAAYEYSPQEIAAEQNWHSEFIQWRWGLKMPGADGQGQLLAIRPADVGPAARFLSGLLNPLLGGAAYVAGLLDKLAGRPPKSKTESEVGKQLQAYFDALNPDSSANAPAAELAAAVLGPQALPIAKQLVSLPATGEQRKLSDKAKAPTPAELEAAGAPDDVKIRAAADPEYARRWADKQRRIKVQQNRAKKKQEKQDALAPEERQAQQEQEKAKLAARRAKQEARGVQQRAAQEKQDRRFAAVKDRLTDAELERWWRMPPGERNRFLAGKERENKVAVPKSRIGKGLLGYAAKVMCETGQTAAQTGCTPASGESAQKPRRVSPAPPQAGTLPDGRTVEFTRHPSSGPHEVLVMVDPARLDPAWERGAGPSFYLPAGGEGQSEIRGRREMFREFLGRGKPIEASRVVLEADGAVDFIDGRHRFAVLRDLGIDRVAVMVDRREKARLEQLFGAEPPARQKVAVPKSRIGKGLLGYAAKAIPGGLAEGVPDDVFDPEQLAAGIEVELEHTSDPVMAKEIAKDHLMEDPRYYVKLRQLEDKALSALNETAGGALVPPARPAGSPLPPSRVRRRVKRRRI